MSAGVFGAGPIGLLLIRALRAVGAGRIVATDALPHRVEAALASGADEAYLTPAWPASPTASSRGSRSTSPSRRPARTPRSNRPSSAVRIGGRVVVVGIPATNRHSFTARHARGKGLTLAFSRRMKAIHMLRAIELVDHGLVSLDGLITRTYPLGEAAAAFDALVARSGLKVIVKPNA